MAEYEWLWMLPDRLRPDDVEPERIHALDALRRSWSLDHALFSEILVQSDWATKRLQRQLYEDGRKLHSELSDKELFKEIMMSRTSSRIPMGIDMTEKEVDSVIEEIETIDQLVDFIMTKEQEDEGPDPGGMRSKMNAEICRIMESQDGHPEIRTDAFTRFRNRIKVLITCLRGKATDEV
ncbi:MAG: hypothetical protein JRC93_11010 [Deltaproteobacteria bacterium]|nr:hypothetical protein [Deltaproteobacteria bacterium]